MQNCLMSEKDTKHRSKLNDLIYALANEPEFKSAWSDVEPELQLARFLADARRKKSLTQEQLAELSGVSIEDIRTIEDGTSDPSLRTIERLASVFGKRLFV